MLPDWPELKKEIRSRLDRYVYLRMGEDNPFFQEVSRHQIFEGTQLATHRASGEKDASRLKEISAEFALKNEEASTLTLQGLLDKLDAVAQELAKGHGAFVTETMREVTERTGNTVAGKLGLSTILEAIEKMHIEFDEEGDNRLCFVIHPSMRKAVERADAEFRSSPEQQEQLNEAMRRKYLDWRAREADRALVG